MSAHERQRADRYRRRITPFERLFTRSPFSTVMVVARIRGSVSEEMIRNAVAKAQRRHPNLRVRIEADDQGDPWFTSEGAGEIPVEIVPRESDEHWVRLAREAAQVPYEFGERPPVRYVLAQSPDTSDLIISCHHIICDGLSLAYLARDMMTYLGEPTREVEVLPAATPVTRESMPADVSANAIARFFIKRMNKKWAAEKVLFDQEDYESLCEAYWARYRHELLPVELSEEQTTALVQTCRDEGVTVNSALTAAFVGAQSIVQVEKDHHASIGVAGSLRDRLPNPPGEAMGFYAGVVRPDLRYDRDCGFWDNARRLHGKLRPLYTNRNLFREAVMWSYLDPTILEAINFKRLGGLVPPALPRHDKLSDFGARDDVVKSLLRREKMDSLDTVVMGTAMTNLTRMDFPRSYGPLELDLLTMKPGGAFPLANVNLVVGAVTCAGRLSLALEFVESNITMREIVEIKDRALDFLLVS